MSTTTTISMSVEEIIEWVHQFDEFLTDEECLEAYEVFRSYFDEGQNRIVSLQYAGLL